MPRGVPNTRSSQPGFDPALVDYLVQNIHQQCSQYRGDWTASWLKSSLDDLQWTLDDGSQQSWHLALPNGTSLPDPANDLIRLSAQRIIFLDRTSVFGGAGNNRTMKATIASMFILIRWMYRHEDVYAPAECGFKRLDTLALKDYVSKLAKGGVPWALEYPHDLLAHWYSTILNQAPPRQVLDNPFAVPPEHCTVISDWLSSQNYYHHPTREGYCYIDRSRLIVEMDWDKRTVTSSPIFNAFLRLFEPTVTSPVLRPRRSSREYPSHRTPLLADAQKEGSIRSNDHHMLALNSILSCHRHLPDVIPDTSSIKLSEVRKVSEGLLATPQHTPWIPLKIALSFTSEAIRIIHVYGDAIVSAYVAAAKIYADGCTPGRKTDLTRKSRAIAVPIPEALRSLNAVGWTSSTARSHGDFSLMRQKPGLNDLFSILVGAVLTLTSQLKPSRESEITDLRDDCIRFSEGDGYWLRQTLAKSTRVGQRITVEKPIPRIVAKGILQIKTAKDGLLDILGEHPSGNRLFLLPDILGDKNLTLLPMSSDRQKTYLDRFCDWANLPPDEYGRRWYVRTHEGRKSFLLTFFWCFRFASLDAARWLAGHNDAAHIYAYIEANFPGMELPSIEAEYAAMQMWAFESGDIGETDNVVDLYRVVCRHFSVSAISLVSSEDLMAWLEVAFSKGTYKIQPYSVRPSSGQSGTRICFRISQ